MTKYPCANSCCVNDVKVPGQYCPKCQRQIQAEVERFAEDQQKENDRKRYERHHGKDDKK